MRKSFIARTARASAFTNTLYSVSAHKSWVISSAPSRQGSMQSITSHSYPGAGIKAREKGKAGRVKVPEWQIDDSTQCSRWRFPQLYSMYLYMIGRKVQKRCQVVSGGLVLGLGLCYTDRNIIVVDVEACEESAECDASKAQRRKEKGKSWVVDRRRGIPVRGVIYMGFLGFFCF